MSSFLLIFNYSGQQEDSYTLTVSVSNFKNNNRFQGIIGSYGTGKSTFLWAFEQYLLGNNKYFDSKENEVLGNVSFKFIKVNIFTLKF